MKTYNRIGAPNSILVFLHMRKNTNRCEKLETLFAHWKIRWRDDKCSYFKFPQCYSSGVAEIVPKNLRKDRKEIIHFIGRQVVRSTHETLLDHLHIDNEQLERK